MNHTFNYWNKIRYAIKAGEMAAMCDGDGGWLPYESFLDYLSDYAILLRLEQELE